MRRAILVVVFFSFTVFSLFVTVSDGFSGLLGVVMREKWGLQMLLDLAIALTVAWTWLRHDAKARGITAWEHRRPRLPGAPRACREEGAGGRDGVRATCSSSGLEPAALRQARPSP